MNLNCKSVNVPQGCTCPPLGGYPAELRSEDFKGRNKLNDNEFLRAKLNFASVPQMKPTQYFNYFETTRFNQSQLGGRAATFTHEVQHLNFYLNDYSKNGSFTIGGYNQHLKMKNSRELIMERTESYLQFHRSIPVEKVMKKVSSFDN